MTTQPIAMIRKRVGKNGVGGRKEGRGKPDAEVVGAATAMAKATRLMIQNDVALWYSSHVKMSFDVKMSRLRCEDFRDKTTWFFIVLHTQDLVVVWRGFQLALASISIRT